MSEQKVTLGGDRLGSGNRMKQRLHNYYRSNHNLSKQVKTSAACGVLYPVYTNIAVNGDTFKIDTKAFCRTIPTQAPLFGSFKLQVDWFMIPIRLYNSILHNNITEIGLNMSKVKIPKVILTTSMRRGEMYGLEPMKKQISSSSLIKFLGISGIGRPIGGDPAEIVNLQRKVNAIPMLAYYDIFKNYYSNKQEDNAYVITSNVSEGQTAINNIWLMYDSQVLKEINFVEQGSVEINSDEHDGTKQLRIIGSYLNKNNIMLTIDASYFEYGQAVQMTLAEWENQGASLIEDRPPVKIKTKQYGANIIDIDLYPNAVNTKYKYIIEITGESDFVEENVQLKPFPLKNIDEMRKRILTFWEEGSEFIIDRNESLLPYSLITNTAPNGESYNKYAMNGLCVKTYQSDMFNNWLNREWIEGLNGVNETSAISTATGSFTIDALNLANKIYNYLNRIAISGGTYEDWQKATWGNKVLHSIEKPIYCGGMSSEVMFEEVVSTAATADAPLGTIGGRGALNQRASKGGNILIKVSEPSIIMAIASLTPRIDYTQGNKWYMTELDSLEDLHKPEFDQIGFQNAMTEQLAWWDVQVAEIDVPIQRTSFGKQPAWLHYMTDVNEAYGDFADGENKNFMVLSRNYEKSVSGGVKDVTTYIDPKKFNYAFAYTELAAQNFWLFFNFDIKARRIMSAKQIPNL